MNRRTVVVAALAATTVLGTAACNAAVPQPTRMSTSADPAPSTRAPAESEAPDGSPPARSTRPSANRLDLEIGRIDPDWLWPMLEFASDSYGIIWSSGVADGTAGDAAPDLWRWVPGRDRPELLWSNPHRDRQLAKIGGDTDVWVFAEISSEGEDWWNLWLLEEDATEPILLDALAPGTDVPSLVPSFDVDDGRVAWTSFDVGPERGRTVSELWLAEAPSWEPRLVARHDAAERALWLPSMYGHQLAYVDVTLAPETADDVRHVMLFDLFDAGASPVQLDASLNATMPVLTDGGVIWKEPDAGFSMFNWGRLFRYAFDTGTITELPMGSQEYVNYPSGGSRFLAAWGADTSVLSVHDLERRASRLVVAVEDDSESIVRAHVSGELLVWMRREEREDGSSPPAPLEWAWLPVPGSDRGN
ncbi:MAG: hypothetical protein K5924_10655 [Chloroflexi bacterium]|nr:hypothetical protein [Chloroflexota bacterium]